MLGGNGRLLISALIEARSCERFLVLARVGEDRELTRFYTRLGASELGHYNVFLMLAERVLPPDRVQKRWGELLEAEAEILKAQSPGPRMHCDPASVPAPKQLRNSQPATSITSVSSAGDIGAEP